MPQDHNKNRTFLCCRYQEEEEDDHFYLITFQSSIDLLQQDLFCFLPKRSLKDKELKLKPRKQMRKTNLALNAKRKNYVQLWSLKLH